MLRLIDCYHQSQLRSEYSSPQRYHDVSQTHINLFRRIITGPEIKDQNGKSLGGPFKNVQKVITKEELLLTMKSTMTDAINVYWENWIRTHTKVEERLHEMQNDRFAIKGITYSNLDNEDLRKYIVTLVINTNTVFENNPPLIEDLIKVATIHKCNDRSNGNLSLFTHKYCFPP